MTMLRSSSILILSGDASVPSLSIALKDGFEHALQADLKSCLYLSYGYMKKPGRCLSFEAPLSIISSMLDGEALNEFGSQTPSSILSGLDCFPPRVFA
jgi:hypothetical protein